MKKIIGVLFLLAACDVKVDGNTITPVQPTPAKTAEPEAEAKAKAEASAAKAKDEQATTGGDTSAPVVTAPPAFCIPHDLRDGYATPIPTTGALYAALIHEGITGRLADPKCYLDRTVTQGGRLHIACAVTLVGTAFGSGPLYGHMWASPDRPWIKDAFLREAFLQNVTSSELDAVVSTASGSSVFAADATLAGQTLVELSISTDVTFNGYCQ